MNLEAFFENARIDIESRLKKNVTGYEQYEKLGYFLDHGKRLRPLLSILVFRACGGTEKKYVNALDLAVAIELQHSASLVHDDIIDGDSKRRSKPSYFNVFGVQDAVLTGHRAIVLGFKNVLGHDPKILETFFDVWDRSLKGEIEDVASRRKSLTVLARKERLYFDVILNKTASLFAGAAKIGSQEAGAPEDLQNLFWDFGKYIGIAYQLVDDKLDLDHGTVDMLPISWIARTQDEKSLGFLADSLKGGMSPSAALSKINIDAESVFDREVAKMQRAAENLVKGEMIPERRFRRLLFEAPKYIIKGCLKG